MLGGRIHLKSFDKRLVQTTREAIRSSVCRTILDSPIHPLDMSLSLPRHLKFVIWDPIRPIPTDPSLPASVAFPPSSKPTATPHILRHSDSSRLPDAIAADRGAREAARLQL
jgi:hypothetical protein